jgi:hypothetical protein
LLNRHQEIFYGYGLLIGFGVWVIDSIMHAQEEGGSFSPANPAAAFRLTRYSTP